MRRAYNRQEFIKDEDGNIFGINLGFDFCYEHECGINKLSELFGVSGTGFGVDARRQTKNPGTVMIHEFTRNKTRLIALICFPSRDSMPNTKTKKELSDVFVSYLGTPWRNELVTAWDDSSFGICTTIENKDKVLQLKESIDNCQLVVGLGLSGPFWNGGLKLLYADKIPQKIADDVYKYDRDRYGLSKAAFESTKIKEILKKAGKCWHALAPKWERRKK